jgi:hypothetical protein
MWDAIDDTLYTEVNDDDDDDVDNDDDDDDDDNDDNGASRGANAFSVRARVRFVGARPYCSVRVCVRVFVSVCVY